MESVKDISIDTLRPKTIVMGPPMVGKTRFSATWPTGNTYTFDFDGNMATVKSMSAEVQNRVFYDTFKDTDSTRPNAYMNAKKVLDTMAANALKTGVVEYEGVQFGHIVLDSATTLVEICMNLHLFATGRIGAMPQVGTQGSNDYTGANHYFKQLVFRALALPCAVTLNCHEHIDQSETEGGVKRVYPDIIGKLATQISSRFMFAFRLTSGTDKDGRDLRMLLTKPKGLYYAGHRFQDALEDYEVADWQSVLNKINTFINKNAATTAGTNEGR